MPRRPLVVRPADLPVFVAFVWMTAAAFLVPVRFLPAFAAAVGRLLSALPGAADRILKNLQTAYGAAMDRRTRAAVARGLLSQTFLNYAEVVGFLKVRPEEYPRWYRAEGLDILNRALAAGRGVVCVCAHIGNFPLMQILLRKRGYPITMIVRNTNNRHIGRFIDFLSSFYAVPFITKWEMERTVNASQEILRQRGILCFYLDQRAGNGVPTRLFGRPASSPVGVALFARRYRAPVVGLFTARTASGRHRIVVEGPYDCAPSCDPSADLRRHTAFFMERVEARVRESPEQWMTWLTRLFR